ncbi:MAG: outer membrane beta-barrel protein [Candidatus Kryptoniota bacterium]
MYQYRSGLLFLILISISVSASAQTQDTSSERNSLKAGACALQFGIASNFTLTSIQGSTIAFKYQLSDRNAIRGGITISGSTSNGSTTVTGSVEDTSYGSKPESSTSDAASISLVLQYLWYINPAGPVHFYLGAGPSASYSYSRSSLDNFNLDIFYNGSNDQGVWEQETNTSYNHQWGVGATGVAGVEWFACPWLSIRAEYSEGIAYQWRPSSSTSAETYINYSNPPSYNSTSGTTKGWSLSSSGVSFGANIYW